jgi:hypothetical protein
LTVIDYPFLTVAVLLLLLLDSTGSRYAKLLRSIGIAALVNCTVPVLGGSGGGDGDAVEFDFAVSVLRTGSTSMPGEASASVSTVTCLPNSFLAAKVEICDRVDIIE